MIRLRLLASLIAAAWALAAAVAVAQPTSPEGGDTRYTFHRADDGYLRLDGRSGQVSLCNRRGSGWQCQLVPDERVALEAEILRLQNDNAALKKELLSRNLPLPEGMRPDQPAPNAQGRRSPLPDDADINRFMSAIERVWRRFVEMIENVQRDIQKRI